MIFRTRCTAKPMPLAESRFSRKGAFLLLDKDPGISSFQVVSRLRKMLGLRRIGHAGTLDPFATGLLLVALGRGTAALQFCEGFGKRYRVLAVLGERRNTLDRCGSVQASYSAEALRQALQEGSLAARLQQILPHFQGTITQYPPMFSAVKIAGQPLYRYARAGEEKERPARQAEVEVLDCRLFSASRLELSADPLDKLLQPQERAGAAALLPAEAEALLYADLRVSKGTYIRSWVDDLGEALGCHAYALALRRWELGPCRLTAQCPDTESLFSLYHQLNDDSERLADALQAAGQLLSYKELFAGYPSLEVDARQKRQLLQGQSIPCTGAETGQVLLMAAGECLGMGTVHQTEAGTFLRVRRAFTDLSADGREGRT